MSSSVQTAGAATLSPSLLAGALVFASRHLDALGLPHPTHVQILAATGARSTRAYARAQDLEAALRTLDRPVGRPRKEAPPPPAPSSREELQARLLAFFLEHPGCVVKKQQRRSYSDELRRFLVALHEEYREHLSFEEFALVVQIPEKTLRPWLRLREDASPAPADGADHDDEQSDEDVHERIRATTFERLAAAWDTWTGSFEAFFRYARSELGVTAGKDHIRNVLEALRVRPVHRRGPAPDQTALRQSFETFFPGAQWVGDGTELTFTLNGEPFTCHLELFVDAGSAALTGAAVRDQEDAAAVIDAFRDGAATAGFPPIAALLDNRPSNHTDDVHAALDPTLPIRATRGRAQNKAHVEGSFGLFSRTAPLLSLHASTPRDLAVGVIELVVTTWARTLNHKPRPGRGGLSRVQLYQQAAPTPEQIAHARARLTALQRKQQLAYETRTRHLDPVACQLIDDAFASLAIADPPGTSAPPSPATRVTPSSRASPPSLPRSAPARCRPTSSPRAPAATSSASSATSPTATTSTPWQRSSSAFAPALVTSSSSTCTATSSSSSSSPTSRPNNASRASSTASLPPPTSSRASSGSAPPPTSSSRSPAASSHPPRARHPPPRHLLPPRPLPPRRAHQPPRPHRPPGCVTCAPLRRCPRGSARQPLPAHCAALSNVRSPSLPDT